MYRFYTIERKRIMGKKFIISEDLFIAINNLCTGVESKILFAIIGHGENTPFIPKPTYMQKLTGLTQQNHYYINRKKLIDKGYIVMDRDGLHVNTDAILNDYKEEFKC